MKKLFDYKDFENKLNELGVYADGIGRFDNYLTDIQNDKKTLENFSKEINILKDIIINLDIEDIKFYNPYKDNENFYIDIDVNQYHTLSKSIERFLKNIEKYNETLYNKIIADYYNYDDTNLIFRFDVQIERNDFNKFHFPLSLPPFMKNLGLGKKIVLVSVLKFDYCLFRYSDSDELKMVVDSLVRRTDIFSFMKDKEVMIFKDDFNIINNILKNWLVDYNDVILDKDFLDKYKDEIIKDEFLKNLYKDKL
jgi:hypothetical protein